MPAPRRDPRDRILEHMLTEANLPANEAIQLRRAAEAAKNNRLTWYYRQHTGLALAGMGLYLWCALIVVIRSLNDLKPPWLFIQIVGLGTLIDRLLVGPSLRAIHVSERFWNDLLEIEEFDEEWFNAGNDQTPFQPQMDFQNRHKHDAYHQDGPDETGPDETESQGYDSNQNEYDGCDDQD